MRDGRFVRRPAVKADSVVDLRGQFLVPPYADAHTHSPDGPFDIDAIRELYLKAGVFYVQVLANHRSGRLALGDKVNVPTSVDAQFADAAITSTGGHPQVLYESLALFRTTLPDSIQRPRAARSLTQDRDVYNRLDSLPQLAPLIQRLRKDTLQILKVMVLDAENFDRLRADPTSIGGRGVDARVLKPLVDSAHAMGRRVWVHVETARDFALSLDAGVDGFAHVPGYGVAWLADSVMYRFLLTDAMVKKAAARRVPVVTTLGLSRDVFLKDTAARRRVEAVMWANVRKLDKAGVPLITGSDTYSSAEAIENDHLALGDALGASLLRRLRIRTIDTPRAIFPGRRIGALDIGYEASLLSLRCNPLRELACQGAIVGRLKQGSWIASSLTPTP